MKPFSPNRKIINRATAKNVTLLNLLGTPGLGSLMGRRWFAGAGQLVLSIGGFALVMAWAVGMIIHYYGLAFGSTAPHPANLKMLVMGTVLFAAAWLWSAATSFSLLREASTASLKSLENFAAPPPLKLDDAKIFLALASVPDWKFQDAAITRTFQFKDFPAAIKFVNAVADIAEASWHHPDIDIRWNKVTLTLTTHDAGGLTEKDFTLAKQFDGLSSR
jgi:4a-hydroxytetrahydrobiopterin dehydratase